MSQYYNGTNVQWFAGVACKRQGPVNTNARLWLGLNICVLLMFKFVELHLQQTLIPFTFGEFFLRKIINFQNWRHLLWNVSEEERKSIENVQLLLIFGKIFIGCSDLPGAAVISVKIQHRFSEH